MISRETDEYYTQLCEILVDLKLQSKLREDQIITISRLIHDETKHLQDSEGIELDCPCFDCVKKSKPDQRVAQGANRVTPQGDPNSGLAVDPQRNHQLRAAGSTSISSGNFTICAWCSDHDDISGVVSHGMCSQCYDQELLFNLIKSSSSILPNDLEKMAEIEFNRMNDALAKLLAENRIEYCYGYLLPVEVF